MTRGGKNIIKFTDKIGRFNGFDFLFGEVIINGFFDNRVQQIRGLNTPTDKTLHRY